MNGPDVANLLGDAGIALGGPLSPHGEHACFLVADKCMAIAYPKSPGKTRAGGHRSNMIASSIKNDSSTDCDSTVRISEVFIKERIRTTTPEMA